MKGMDLPINMIVIVAIAVLVLVVVVGFFGGFFTRGLGDIEFNKAFDGACNQLRASWNCNPDSISRVSSLYQGPGDSGPESYSMNQLCYQKLGKGVATRTGSSSLAFQDLTGCARSCGCAV
ncbi:MAG: hypothetical protein J4469_01700 [Candidatus Aenigmarchaeota archaeon]|nr:hypothetical protein [Candidatus Aenigmarchaeota archaeon]